MRIRVLLVSMDKANGKRDQQILTDQGFQVFHCDSDKVPEKAGEIQPEIILINSAEEVKGENNLYNTLSNNVLLARFPIVFTLAENEVYLINRSRTAMKEDRYLISNSLFDAMNQAVRYAA